MPQADVHLHTVMESLECLGKPSVSSAAGLRIVIKLLQVQQERVHVHCPVGKGVDPTHWQIWICKSDGVKGYHVAREHRGHRNALQASVHT